MFCAVKANKGQKKAPVAVQRLVLVLVLDTKEIRDQ